MEFIELGKKRTLEMSTGQANPETNELWESAHICPNCGHVIALAQLDLGAITTGITFCTQCEWAGKIEIRIVDARQIGS